MRRPIEIEGLRQALALDGETGILRWKQRPGTDRVSKAFNTRYAGKIAGSVGAKGYRTLRVFQQDILAHRVVFAIHHGRWPDGEVDHQNHNRDDNRPINLKEVTGQVNHLNLKKYANNSSGVTGVIWFAKYRKWRAEICCSGKRTHLGVFDCLGLAIAARREAERSLGFSINHGRA